MDHEQAKKSKMRKHALLVVVGLAGVALAYSMLGPGNEGPEEPNSPDRSPSAADKVGVPGFAIRGYGVGDRHLYDLELSTDVSGPQGTLIQYDLQGQWVVEVVDELPQGIRLMTYVDDPQLDSPMAQKQPKLADRLRESAGDFSRPLLVDLDMEGRVQHVHVDPKTELQVRSMQRAIATAMQLVRPSADAKEWETTEPDVVGVYRAKYRAVDDTHVERRKLRYEQLSRRANNLLGNSATKVSLRESLASFQLSGAGAVEQLHMKEVTEVEGTVLGGVISTTTYRLSHRTTDADANASRAAQLSAKLQRIRPFEHAENNGFSTEADRARVDGRTYADLLGELRSLPLDRGLDTDLDKTRRRKNFIALGALIRLNDSAANEVLKTIRNDKEHARVLWDALANAGTPAAQRALREVIAMPEWSKGERRSQMVGLSMVKEPTAETVDLLRSMTDDPDQGQQARYGMGTAAHNLAETEPERAEAIIADLSERLETADNALSQSDYIRSLGNTGHPDALRVLQPHLSSNNDSVRGAAVWALRMQSGAQVDARIAEVMVQDPSKAVRKSALRAARTRGATDTLVNAVAHVYNHAGDQDVRSLAQPALLRFDRQHPGLLAQISGGASAP